MRINVGDKVVHFKGGVYKVLAIARHADDLGVYVVYQALEAPNEVWIRGIEAFLSPVDRQKYPQARQQFRFEKMLDF